MDLSSSSKRSTVSVQPAAMGVSFAENIHEPSSSSKQLFSGMSKGTSSLTTATNPAANDSSSNLSRLGSLSQTGNLFRPDNHSHSTINASTAGAGGQANLTDNINQLSLKRNISGSNINLSSSNNNSNNSSEDKDINIVSTNNSNINRASTRVGMISTVSENNEHNGGVNNGAVRYKECMKNHAANMGGYALDGCGEFMPSGEEGSLEALKCAACGCHRNFHRREMNGGSLHGTVPSTNMSLLALPSPLNTSNTSASNTSEYGEGDHNTHGINNGMQVAGSGPGAGGAAPAATGLIGAATHYNAGHMGPPLLPHLHHHHHHHQYMNHAWMASSKLVQGGGAAGSGHHNIHARGMHVHHAGGAHGHGAAAHGAGPVMGQYPAYHHHLGMGPGVHNSILGAGGHGVAGAAGKRFRTKFTMEQREKMFEFSEKVGWRIQKQDEAAVQQFCAEAGVKRHVLKVWMHNNKNTFGKKLLRFPEAFNAMPESSS